MFDFLNYSGRPFLMGHRGAMDLYPENTLVSFQRAVEMGVDMVELDVHLARDRMLMVIHDERLERTTTGTGLVGDHTSQELQRFDAGVKFRQEFKGERIPLLGDVIDLLAPTKVALNIEIKNGPIFYSGIAKAVADYVRRREFAPRTVVSSFDHHVLFDLKSIAPEIRVAPLVVSTLHNPSDYLRSMKADGLHPRWNYVTKWMIEDLHRHGYFLNTWILHTREEFARFADWGVDAVGVNNPDKFR